MPTTPAVGGRLHAGAGGRAKAVECGPFVAQRASEPPMSLIRFNHRARRIAVALSLASTAFLAAAGEAELPKLVVGDRYVYHRRAPIFRRLARNPAPNARWAGCRGRIVPSVS